MNSSESKNEPCLAISIPVSSDPFKVKVAADKEFITFQGFSKGTLTKDL